mmetsp:Transcript_15349/g.30062  ORF Transcript_15349/g.30062 Transcript_15349/m.30062 type:complete len:133 (-) Transcript_15349:374-772(-)
MYAKRDIPRDTELTWDYNFATVGTKTQQCLCGASNCSGTFGSRPKPKDQSKKKALKRKKHRLEDSIEFKDINGIVSHTKKMRVGTKALTLSNTEKKFAREHRLLLPRNCEKVLAEMAKVHEDVLSASQGKSS